MYVMFLSSYAVEIENIYKDMTRIYNALNLRTATGIDLDIIGEKFNINRPAAKKSQTTLTFNINKSIDDDIVIPIGTQVRTSKNEIYYTIEEGVIISGNTSVNIEARSVLTGYNSRVAADTLTEIISKINTNTTVYVTNNSASSGGKPVCSDEEYRDLIQAWAYSHNRGTKEAYDLFFMTYEGLNGYRLIPCWDGTGTLKIVVDPGTDYIINDLKQLLLESVQMYDDDVLIVPAVEKLVDVNATVNIDLDSVHNYSEVEKDDILLRVQNNIQIFINGGYKTDGVYYPGLTLGEDFIPHKCSVFLDNMIPELKSVSFTDSYIAISEDEKAVAGEINITIE